MTITVVVKHTMPNYDKCITVEEMAVDVNGDPVSKGIAAYKNIVQPGGETRELYVWPGQCLMVTEGPLVADLTKKDDTNQ